GARAWKLARSARSKKARNSTARMIANLRICYHPSPMADRPNARFPWLLIAASVLLVLVILYVLFVGYLPAKQRIAGLEAELKDLYRREPGSRPSAVARGAPGRRGRRRAGNSRASAGTGSHARRAPR